MKAIPRKYKRAITLYQSWPLWYVAVALIGLISMPVTIFFGGEWFLYSIALTIPLWLLLAFAGFIGVIALFANATSWCVGRVRRKHMK